MLAQRIFCAAAVRAAEIELTAILVPKDPG
jgi:hypothetical protein